MYKQAMECFQQVIDITYISLSCGTQSVEAVSS